DHSKDARARGLALLAFAVLASLAMSACTSSGGAGAGGGGGSGGSGGAGTKAVLDTAKAVEASIVTSDGGMIGLKTDEFVARVTFPLDALATDTVLVATPLTQAPGQDDKTLVKGFQLEEKGTGAGPKLAYPAYIEMVVAQELPEGFSLVSYKPDGSFDVLPTKVKVGKGVSAVFALAPHFSPMGGRDVGKDAADKARDQFSDYNWVVWVRGKASGSNGPLQQTVFLTMRAVNGGGDIAGDYTGDAQIMSTNTGNFGPMKTDSTQTGKSDSVKITLTEGDPLAPLTPQDPLAPLTEDPLAPLTPADLPSWFGSGSITMSAMAVKGSASGYIGGYGGAGPTKDTSTLPVTLQVTGTQVSMDVSGLPIGKATFKGYVIGQGK
ncbi:MAG TPA: hypothetical protein VF902_10495, partial [Coriobacteriia bacterium]